MHNVARALLGTLLALLLFSSIGTAAEQAWIEIAPNGEPWKLEMPAEPKRREAQDDTIVGTVDRVTFYFEQDGRSYNANRIDLPTIATMFMSDNALLDEVRDGLLEADHATEKSYEDIEKDGHTGKRLVYAKKDETGPRVARAEFFVVDDQVLNFVAAVPDGAPTDLVERFFESIELPKD